MIILPENKILKYVKCPICQSTVDISSVNEAGCTSLYCRGPRRHCFDFSKGGYVNLMPPGYASGGDSKQAVRARTDFLNLDFYRPVADTLAELMTQYADPKQGYLIDAGCGEGYYTSALAEKGYCVAGVDLSRFAVNAAAKRMRKTEIDSSFFSVSSVFELPFVSESASAIVNIFAPCAEAEFMRVLQPNGILAVVYAGPEHLMGMKRAMYEQIKENDERADLPEKMELLKKQRLQFTISVKGSDNLQNLFAMTPYYWRTSLADKEKLYALESLETTVDFIISLYKKAEAPEPRGSDKEELCKYL